MRNIFKKNEKKISCYALMFAGIIVLSSCNSASAPQQSQISADQVQQLQDKMFAIDKPESHFDEVRDYVFEEYPDLPSDVELLVKNTKPKVVKNESKMEYCFFWTLPDGSIIEVVTTPPPLFDPIGIHHSKRIQYE